MIIKRPRQAVLTPCGLPAQMVFRAYRPPSDLLNTAKMVRLLFSNSEQGAVYDPSDPSTLFQDIAGTVPVTAVEQAVALMLDKSGRGNHATQATSTKRPVYSRRVNLITKSEDFSNAAWTTGKSAGASVASNTAIAPNGELTADTVTFTASTDYLYQPVSSFNAVAGSSIVLKYCSKVTGRVIVLGGATPAGTDVHIYIDIGGGWYEHKTTRTFSVSVTGLVQVIPQGTIAGAGSFALWGASLTLGTDAHLPYQWVNTATDYDADPAKFPAYLADDGIDDAMQTGNIDFTGTDKMTVWAGVHFNNISGGAQTIVNHNGAGWNAGIWLSNPNLDGRLRTMLSGNNPDFAAAQSSINRSGPFACVVTGSHDYQGSHTLRVNSVQEASIIKSLSGRPGNGIISIGAVSTIQYLNGRLYSLIVRGAQSSLSQIEATEAYIKQKMRLP